MPIDILRQGLRAARRSGAVQAMHAPSWVSSLGHFVLFAGMAMVLAARPLAWPVARIVLAALALALLTEGLQFFAIDRHPRLVDVGIDLAGAGVGLMVGWVTGQCSGYRDAP